MLTPLKPSSLSRIVPRSSESPLEAEVDEAADDGSALLRLLPPPLPCDEVDVGGPISPDRRDDDRSDEDLSCECWQIRFRL